MDTIYEHKYCIVMNVQDVRKILPDWKVEKSFRSQGSIKTRNSEERVSVSDLFTVRAPPQLYNGELRMRLTRRTFTCVQHEHGQQTSNRAIFSEPPVGLI